MSLYNLSEFLTTIKEDIGIKDIPLPVSDNDIINRFQRSALVDFSIICPKVVTAFIGNSEITKIPQTDYQIYHEYRIPKYYYDGTIILNATNLQVARPNGYADYFIPNANWSSPDAIIGGIADLKMAATLSSAITKSPTLEFIKPDIIRVYNGWAGGIYTIELYLRHDLSLASISEDYFPDLRELTILDIEEYLYNQLKRKDGLDAGVGSIQLKIDDWSNAAADKKELLHRWRSEGSNLDLDHIRYF